MKNVKKLLTRAWIAYAEGKPFMSDSVFDALASKYGYDEFTEGDLTKKVKHPHRMYSLQKVFDDEPSPLPIPSTEEVYTPKLDGSCIRLSYEDGILVEAATRGDGIEGEDITSKAYLIETIPNFINIQATIQIDGEVVCSKEIENARNYVSGALNTKDLDEFKSTKAIHLVFVAYSVRLAITEAYHADMNMLEDEGFITVLDGDYCVGFFRTDGTVYRINSNSKYYDLGYTSKHPRGAYARKKKSDVAVEETVLLDVIWQVGRSGKITPVALFDEIVIDDAKINRATLNNVGFIEEMGLEIGDIILVTRSGGIIPKVLGKL